MKTVARGHKTAATAALAALLLCAPVAAQERGAPYGPYKKSPARSGYGEKRPVSTVGEARMALEGHIKGRGLSIGKITEKELFFEAELFDQGGRLADLVIIDKRTGRVRSIY